MRVQLLEFVRPIAGVLEQIEGRGAVTAGDFTELCLAKRIDRFWIWDQFHGPAFSGVRHDPPTFLFPPVDLKLDPQDSTDRGEVTVNQGGRRLLAHWRVLAPFARSPEALDVAVELQDGFSAAMQATGPGIPLLDYRRACRRLHAKDEPLAIGLAELVPETGCVRLTSEGEDVAGQWRFIRGVGDPGPEPSWAANFWPNEAEERSLPPDWDWDARPIPPVRDSEVRRGAGG